MRERVHEEGGAVEHGHEGHSAAGAVVRGAGELDSGRGRRRGGGRSGWGGGSVDHGRWGGEDKRHASVGTDHCRLERLDEENTAMVSVVLDISCRRQRLTLSSALHFLAIVHWSPARSNLSTFLSLGEDSLWSRLLAKIQALCSTSARAPGHRLRWRLRHGARPCAARRCTARASSSRPLGR